MKSNVVAVLLEAIDSGELDSKDVLHLCVDYMGDRLDSKDVLKMCFDYMGDAHLEDMLDINDLSDLYQGQSDDEDFIYEPMDNDEYESEADDY